MVMPACGPENVEWVEGSQKWGIGGVAVTWWCWWCWCGGGIELWWILLLLLLLHHHCCCCCCTRKCCCCPCYYCCCRNKSLPLTRHEGERWGTSRGGVHHSLSYQRVDMVQQGGGGGGRPTTQMLVGVEDCCCCCLVRSL